MIPFWVLYLACAASATVGLLIGCICAAAKHADQQIEKVIIVQDPCADCNKTTMVAGKLACDDCDEYAVYQAWRKGVLYNA